MSTVIATDIRTGSCLCGNVKYSVKVTGSALAANAMFKKDQLKILSGQKSIKGFLDKAVDSGNVLRRSFCVDCGSSLFIENTTSDKTSNIIAIMTGGLDGDKGDWRPKIEFYDDKRYGWIHIQKGAGKL